MKSSMKAHLECVRSENAMQFSHHHQLATSLPLHSITWSVYRWPAGSYTGTVISNLLVARRSRRVLPRLGGGG